MSVGSNVVQGPAEARVARHAFTDSERRRGSRSSATRRREAAQRAATARRAWLVRERELYQAYVEADGRRAHDARHAWRQHLAAGPGA